MVSRVIILAIVPFAIDATDWLQKNVSEDVGAFAQPASSAVAAVSTATPVA